MDVRIKKVYDEYAQQAIDLFAKAFIDDPLYTFAFPEKEHRSGMTRLMYEFVVREMVPGLNLTMKGAFTDNILIGCIIYTTLKSTEWNDELTNAAMEMRKKANDPRMELIGEYASLCSKYRPEVKHYYGNELAVKQEFRNRGIAKLLVYEMIKDFESCPDAEIIAIDTTNENNLPIYRKWGWKINTTVNFHGIKVYSLWR